MNLKNLAMEVGSNRTYISKALRYKGLNYHRYMNSFRILYALGLMARNERRKMNYEEIAENSGFSGCKSMNRNFMSSFGMCADAIHKRIDRQSMAMHK